MTERIETLIATLLADLHPVRPLRPPLWRAGLWLGVVLAAACVSAAFANLPAIAERLRTAPDMPLAILGSSLTTVLAAIAAFEISLPDRRSAWALLPVPGAVLWVAATGMGCLRTWVSPAAEPLADLTEARHCFVIIVGLSIPLSLLMLGMVRRACPLRPGMTAAVGGLAVAAGAATLLNFFHPYDAGATDIAVHVAAIAAVIGLNRLWGGRLLAGSHGP